MRKSTLQFFAVPVILLTLAAWPGYVNADGLNSSSGSNISNLEQQDTQIQSTKIDLQRGLQAYFPFSGNANDESGKGNNLPLNGASLAKDRFGNPNKAYRFNGKKNVLPFTGAKIKKPVTTISFWVQVPKKANNLLEVSIVPGKLSMSLCMVKHRYQLQMKVNNKKIIIRDKADLASEYPEAFDFITILVDGKSLRFMINNQLAGVQYLDKKTLERYFPFTLKKSPTFSSKATLDDIRIYSRVLNEQELEALFAETNSVPELSFEKHVKANIFSADMYTSVISDGGSEITEMGFCWNTTGDPDTSDNKTSMKGYLGLFKSTLTGLSPNTTYHVKSYAINKNGIGYSTENYEFTTLPDLNYGSVTDIDGNNYRTITIGTQTWMAENLKTTRYADGTPIKDGTSMSSEPGKYYYIFFGDTILRNIYGLLYTWEAATNAKPGDLYLQGVQGACPDGWHIPGYAEKEALIDFMGGIDYAGDKMKEAGEAHWDANNQGTNPYGFSALGSGLKVMEENLYGAFVDFRALTYFWTSESYSNIYDQYFAPVLTVYTGYSSHYWSPDINYGAPVRCIQNNNVDYVKKPEVSTAAISEISNVMAIGGGIILSDGGQFKTKRGLCWSTHSKPDTSGSKSAAVEDELEFNDTITGLKPNTKYYVRAYCITSAGISYGNEVSFTTASTSMNASFADKLGSDIGDKDSQIDFYPNPASTSIQFNNLPENTIVTLYNSNGKVLKEASIVNNTFDVSDLKDGVYYLKIKSGDDTILKKLVKQ